MDNLAKVAMVEYGPGLIIPCIKLNKGVFVASKSFTAPFTVHLVLAFASGGVRKRIETDILVSATTISTDMPSDATNVYVDTPPISVREIGSPDPGTSLATVANITIQDTAGKVQCSPPDFEQFPVPRPQ